MAYSKNNNGFTLVELAIVITIIALVVAGILSGQTMIQNAKLISVYDDISRFSTAFNSFRDSYRAIPGDLDPLPGASFNGVGTLRNNGAIEWWDWDLGSGSELLDNGTIQTSESTLFWQHLFIAGLNDFNPVLSSQVEGPRSKIQGALYVPFSFVATNFSQNNYNIQIRAIVSVFDNPVLSAQDAFFLDSKYDDGKPLTGSIWFNAGWVAGFPDCLVTGNQDYKVDSATGNKKSCVLNFALPK
jgi:prepilin-type N-terminal cleavage/methylation domain-containing protein